MPVYVYETIPRSDADFPQTFDLRPSMTEPSLAVHPDTGVPVRRVLSGGLTMFTGGAAGVSPGSGPAYGGGGCCSGGGGAS